VTDLHYAGHTLSASSDATEEQLCLATIVAVMYQGIPRLLGSNKQLSAALSSNAFVNMTSRNNKTTVARQAVNTTLLNSGAFYMAVLYVVPPEAK
jgi:hypothetical protein